MGRGVAYNSRVIYLLTFTCISLLFLKTFRQKNFPIEVYSVKRQVLPEKVSLLFTRLELSRLEEFINSFI